MSEAFHDSILAVAGLADDDRVLGGQDVKNLLYFHVASGIYILGLLDQVVAEGGEGGVSGRRGLDSLLLLSVEVFDPGPYVERVDARLLEAVGYLGVFKEAEDEVAYGEVGVTEGPLQRMSSPEGLGLGCGGRDLVARSRSGWELLEGAVESSVEGGEGDSEVEMGEVGAAGAQGELLGLTDRLVRLVPVLRVLGWILGRARVRVSLSIFCFFSGWGKRFWMGKERRRERVHGV